MHELLGRGACVLLLTMLGVAPAVAHERPPAPRTASVRRTDGVVLNGHSLRFHKASCTWAKRSARSCVSVRKGEAVRRGAVACKVCGG